MSVVIQQAENQQAEIQLTEKAKQHFLKSLLSMTDCVGVRLSLKKSGCSGYAYEVDFISEVNPTDITQPLDEHWLLAVEKTSLPFLKGVAIDYVKQGLNYKLVFNNPNQSGVCGCGESFTV